MPASPESGADSRCSLRAALQGQSGKGFVIDTDFREEWPGFQGMGPWAMCLNFTQFLDFEGKRGSFAVLHPIWRQLKGSVNSMSEIHPPARGFDSRMAGQQKRGAGEEEGERKGRV